MPKNKPRGYWTLKRCKIDAKKYDERHKWYEHRSGGYTAAWRNGWLEICCKHMKKLRFIKGELTKEYCHEKALKCKTKTEFRERFPAEHQKAYRSPWYEDVCFHMEKIGSRYFRALYAYEHPDKTVYVGLTYNYQERHIYHMSHNKILKQKYWLGGQIFKKFNIFYPKEIVGKEESKLIEEYRSNGWTILNKNKAGSLGGGKLIWTKKACMTAARKCNTPTQFKKKYAGAYDSARYEGWLKECYEHMESANITKRKIKCIETGIVFESVSEAARKLGIGRCQISKFLNKNSNYAGGYTFEYVN